MYSLFEGYLHPERSQDILNLSAIDLDLLRQKIRNDQPIKYIVKCEGQYCQFAYNHFSKSTTNEWQCESCDYPNKSPDILTRIQEYNQSKAPFKKKDSDKVEDIDYTEIGQKKGHPHIQFYFINLASFKKEKYGYNEEDDNSIKEIFREIFPDVQNQNILLSVGLDEEDCINNLQAVQGILKDRDIKKLIDFAIKLKKFDEQAIKNWIDQYLKKEYENHLKLCSQTGDDCYTIKIQPKLQEIVKQPKLPLRGISYEVLIPYMINRSMASNEYMQHGANFRSLLTIIADKMHIIVDKFDFKKLQGELNKGKQLGSLLSHEFKQQFSVLILDYKQLQPTNTLDPILKKITAFFINSQNFLNSYDVQAIGSYIQELNNTNQNKPSDEATILDLNNIIPYMCQGAQICRAFYFTNFIPKTGQQKVLYDLGQKIRSSSMSFDLINIIDFPINLISFLPTTQTDLNDIIRLYTLLTGPSGGVLIQNENEGVRLTGKEGYFDKLNEAHQIKKIAQSVRLTIFGDRKFKFFIDYKGMTDNKDKAPKLVINLGSNGMKFVQPFFLQHSIQQTQPQNDSNSFFQVQVKFTDLSTMSEFEIIQNKKMVIGYTKPSKGRIVEENFRSLIRIMEGSFAPDEFKNNIRQLIKALEEYITYKQSLQNKV